MWAEGRLRWFYSVVVLAPNLQQKRPIPASAKRKDKGLANANAAPEPANFPRNGKSTTKENEYK